MAAPPRPATRAKVIPATRSEREVRSQAQAAKRAKAGANAMMEQARSLPRTVAAPRPTNSHQSGSQSAKAVSSGRRILRGAKSKPGRMRKIAGNHDTKCKMRNRDRGKPGAASAQITKQEMKPGNCFSIQTSHGPTRRANSSRLAQLNNG